MEVYLYKEINKYLGISFDDFINRPRYEIELMIKNLNEFIDKKNKASEKIMDNIRKGIPSKPNMDIFNIDV